MHAGQKVSADKVSRNNAHCSHINQKTQFENPVLEAKKRLNQETAIQQAAAAATSASATVAPSQGDAHTHGPPGSGEYFDRSAFFALSFFRRLGKQSV